MKRLLMIAPAPVIDRGDEVSLDVKFVEGMERQVGHWDGPVECILWQGATTIPFPVETRRSALPWKLVTLSPGQALPTDVGRGHDLVSASADLVETLDLATRGATPVVYSIEYTHRTRCDILALDSSIGPVRRLRRRLWLEVHERRRVAAFRRAAALQSNGYPAARTYRELTSDLHLYLDNRMTLDRYVTDVEIEAREERLASGRPLKVVYSGRLEPMKGAQDLIPLAAGLAARRVAFELDVFGDGSLRGEIESALAARGLSERVRLHGNVDFGSELVPWQRTHADLFLSCHRQGDPSCTYVESMGCGLPIVGYDNEMWGPLCRESRAGWAEPLGDVDALAERIATTSRGALIQAAKSAVEFARRYDFETVFRGRMEHLAGVAARVAGRR